MFNLHDIPHKVIPGYPGYYATADGRIVSTRGRVIKVLQPGLEGQYRKKYMSVKVYNTDNVKEQRKIHQLVLTAWFRPPKNGEVCRHLNGNQFDNRLENLIWGMPQANYRDRIKHATERNVDDMSIKDIITDYCLDHGITKSEFAKLCNISGSVLSNVMNGFIRTPHPRTVKAINDVLGFNAFKNYTFDRRRRRKKAADHC